MTQAPFLKPLRAGETRIIDLPAQDGMAENKHVLEAPCVNAINAALATGRALLVLGEPGIGKSQLARAAAAELRREFKRFAIHSQTEPTDLLYRFDAVARLAEAQLAGALAKDKDIKSLRAKLQMGRFLEPGPLWWAFDAKGASDQKTNFDRRELAETGEENTTSAGDGDAKSRPCVVLIDEMDKADPSVPNGLLDGLGANCFHVPGGQIVRADSEHRPLVVITSNGERELPKAFLRRCVVLSLVLPDAEKDEQNFIRYLAQRAAAHAGADWQRMKAPDGIALQSGVERDHPYAKIAREFVAARRRADLAQRALPGVAEYIELIQTLESLSQHPGEERDIATLLDEHKRFFLEK